MSAINKMLNASYREVVEVTFFRKIENDRDVKFSSKSGRIKSLGVLVTGILTIPLALIKLIANVARRCFESYKKMTEVSFLLDDLPIFLLSPLSSFIFIFRGFFGIIHPAAAFKKGCPDCKECQRKN